MKGFVYSSIGCAVAVVCALGLATAFGQSPAGPGVAQGKAVGPRQPGGLLGDQLGKYLTIEGVKAEGGKVETGTLLVDTVDGKKLDKPILVVIRSQVYTLSRIDHPVSLALPTKERCVFKGFESGEMIGVPPAVVAAAEEQGRKDVPISPKAYQWRPYFVALIVVEPKGLELPKQ